MLEATTISPSARAELVVSSWRTTSAGDVSSPALHPIAEKVQKTSAAAKSLTDRRITLSFPPASATRGFRLRASRACKYYSSAPSRSSLRASSKPAEGVLGRPPVQASFQAVRQVDQRQAYGQVEERSGDQRRRVGRRRLEDPRRAQQLLEPDHRDDGRVLYEHNELVGQRRDDAAERLRDDYEAHRLGVGQAGGPAGLHLALVYALDPGAEDLRHVGGAVEGERDQAREEEALDPYPEVRRGEVDEDYLNEERRPPEDVYVDLRRGGEDPRAPYLHQREHEPQDYPQNLREQRQRDGDEERLQKRVDVLEDQGEIQEGLPDPLQFEKAGVQLHGPLERHRATALLGDLLRGAADPLLVDLLVGAVVLYLPQRLVDVLAEIAPFRERDTVLLAGRDDLDDLERP